MLCLSRLELSSSVLSGFSAINQLKYLNPSLDREKAITHVDATF